MMENCDGWCVHAQNPEIRKVIGKYGQVSYYTSYLCDVKNEYIEANAKCISPESRDRTRTENLGMKLIFQGNMIFQKLLNPEPDKVE